MCTEFCEQFTSGKRIEEIDDERQKLIEAIESVTKRPLLIYASHVYCNDPQIVVMIEDADRIPFFELVESSWSNTEKSVDIFVESSGGVIEVVETMITNIRKKFNDVRFIVPNIAQSAATVMVMSGNEILMESRSALGPIDPQTRSASKRWAAQDLIDGLERIKDEVGTRGLNAAYIPVLQQISPADIQSSYVASELSKDLVIKWLREYMFADGKDGLGNKLDTNDDRHKLATKIAGWLCSRKEWKSHGRHIGIERLSAEGIKVIDYMKEFPGTGKNIRKLLMNILYNFEATNVFKMFQSKNYRLYRQKNIAPIIIPKGEMAVSLTHTCPSCKNKTPLQLNFHHNIPLQEGFQSFPANDKLICNKCGKEDDLTQMRKKFELDFRRQSIRVE